MILGHLNIEAFLTQTRGEVTGRVITDAKDRVYQQILMPGLMRATGFLMFGRELMAQGDTVKVARRVALDEALIAFFGLYMAATAQRALKLPTCPAASCRQSRFHNGSQISSVLLWINLESSSVAEIPLCILVGRRQRVLHGR